MKLMKLTGLLPDGNFAEYPKLKIPFSELQGRINYAIANNIPFVYIRHEERTALIIPADILSRSIWLIEPDNDEPVYKPDYEEPPIIVDWR